MLNRTQRKRFERLMLPYLDAAYTLALWILRHREDAEDVVQAAYARAFQYFDQYKEINNKAWLLTIVRNEAYKWLRKNEKQGNLINFNEAIHSLHEEGKQAAMSGLSLSPEALVSQALESDVLMAAIYRLPVEFREVLLFKEIEGYSYMEIAETVGIPIGTVMSRLSRGRKALLKEIDQRLLRYRTSEL